MLMIRMQRIGRKNMPAFRIIVAEHTRGPKTGNIVEKVGTYNPKTKEKQFNADRIKYWLSVGAKASATVHNMLVSEKIITGAKIAKHQEKPAEPVAAKTADLPAEASAQAGGGSPDSSQSEEVREVKAEAKAPEAETAPAAEEKVEAKEEKVA
ncbi:MAG: 30S ribosomal protein S16 [bacterium]|nr:30S ribosomal protein S16 [bacterium]